MMKAVEKSRQEMLDESRKLYRNLNERIKRIQKIENAPEYALNRFRELQENYPKDIRQLDDKELRQYYRQLKYIDSLKSSRVKTVKNMSATWTPIDDRLKVMSKELQNKFWEVYKKVYAETGLSNLFKYDVLDYIQTKMFFDGEDDEEIINTITSLYNKISKGNSSDESEEDFAIRFTEELHNIL